MSKQRKPADVLAHQQAPSEVADTPKEPSGPRPHTQALGHAFKFHQKKADARRNLPSGPLGGSGRKTNASRSS
jgi:hypothetical protein